MAHLAETILRCAVPSVTAMHAHLILLGYHCDGLKIDSRLDFGALSVAA